MTPDVTPEFGPIPCDPGDQPLEPWVLDLFRQAAQRVPGYAQHLRNHGINAETILVTRDFGRVPPVSKKSYLTRHPLPSLMWEGDITAGTTISASSGSSGSPFFWLRGHKSESDALRLHDEIFDGIFRTRERKTLLIVGFAMGSWIAGTYTYAAATRLASEGHKIVTITPGLNKEEIFTALGSLSPHFDQTVLAGYPPFLKDVVDDAPGHGIDLLNLDLCLLFAGESFSERWRSYVMSRIGDNRGYRCINIYGTADAGMMGHETPFTIFARRIAEEDSGVFWSLFGDATGTPTLVQYDPSIRYFEEVEGRLLFTVDNVMPLVRYDILDRGCILKPSYVVETLTHHGYTVPEGLRRWINKPLLTLHTREDVAASFYALNIYPEHIKFGLEADLLREKITGKFILRTEFDSTTQEPSLHLTVELRSGVHGAEVLRSQIFENVVLGLRKCNGEYNRLCQEIGAKAHPMVTLCGAGDPRFNMKIKHRWNGEDPCYPR